MSKYSVIISWPLEETDIYPDSRAYMRDYKSTEITNEWLIQNSINAEIEYSIRNWNDLTFKDTRTYFFHQASSAMLFKLRFG